MADDHSNPNVMTGNDHDVLLTTSVQVQQILTTITDIKNDRSQLEVRVSAIEKLHDELNPIQLSGIVKQNNQWIHDFKLTWKLMLGMAVGISSLLTFLMNTLLNLSKIGIIK